MALSRLFPAGYVFLSANGQGPAASGVIYFYDNNTTNLATVYTEVTGITESSNPLTLGSDGRLPNDVFTAETLRVRLLDSIGGQIFQDDDVSPGEPIGSAPSLTTLAASSGSSLIGFIHSASGAVATTLQARGRLVIYPQDFGATGDGVADDTAELQACIDGADGREIDLQGLTYKVASTLTLVSDTVLRNGKISFATASDDDVLFQAFGSTGTQYTLTAAPVKGDTSVAVASATGLAAGDWCYIRSNDNFSAIDSGKRGEWVRVLSVVSTTINLEQRIRHTYTTGHTMYKPALISNITLENLTLTGNGYTGTAAQYGLRAYLCKNVNVIRCVADSFGTSAFSIETVLGGNVTDCTVTRGNYSLGTAYGVSITGGCDGVTVKGGRYSYLRHAVSIGGTYFTDFGNVVTGITTAACSDAGIDVHPNTLDTVITGNSVDCYSTDVTQTGDGIVAQGAGTVISGNIVRGWLRNGILAQPLTSATEADDTWVITNNIVNSPRAAATGVSILFSNEKGTGNTVRGLVIGGNVIQSALATSGAGISVINTASGGPIRCTSISGNSVYCRSQAILIQSTATDLIDDVAISGNNLVSLSAAVPVVSLVNGGTGGFLTCISVTGNTIRGGTYGISSTGTAGTRISSSNNIIQGFATGATVGTYAAVDGTNTTT